MPEIDPNFLCHRPETLDQLPYLFASTASDMPGIDPKFLCHRLAVCRDARPVAQKKRKMGEEKRKAADAEVQKLLQANFIREITYTTWLANVVLVKKSNDKWRMCTDYTDLNKACPKDAYPLPCVDRLVDGASGHAVFSFLDAYSSYNQIKMYPADEEKTAFITESANFCYKVMPFGLKNAGATYQRLMDKVFQGQVGRNIEINVDDMVVKSSSLAEHLADLTEIFSQLRRHNMRLNPEKCTFGVKGGKFLGFMLSARGIEANRDKCQAVLDMRSSSNLKELQRLSGRLAALSRFLPRLGDKISPMTRLLRKAAAFSWDEQCEATFATLKTTLATPPILTKPDPLRPILVYLSVSDEAISSVLVQEKEGAQVPVYFVNRLLQDSETRYQLIEKDCAAFVKKCRPCQEHDNLIHQPAEQLHCISSAWPFATWGIDILGPFPVTKGQCKFLIVAVDLFTKWIEAEPLACISAHQVQKFLWKNIITRFGILHTLVTDNGLQFTD
uniref:Retrovirus-related Pol polyprotein from transposon 412 family n=1 Tax=Cajanus cajan TaxID=3821 RepID=A0A151TX65_CAJCA|nr:Retrovirus-related Pol polyprotein from transposon 412 family [Cajanus cajan]